MGKGHVVVFGVASLGCLGVLGVSSVSRVSGAAPPAPTVTSNAPITVPTGYQAGKALSVVPPHVPGSATTLSALMRYVDGTISASNGTTFERALAARLDRMPGGKATAAGLVGAFRAAPTTERQRLLPRVNVAKLGSMPVNSTRLAGFAAANTVVPNVGQYERLSAPTIPAPAAPPVAYRVDLGGIRCNTAPQSGNAPLLVVSEIETGSSDYAIHTHFYPDSGAPGAAVANSNVASASGNLFGGPTGTTAGLGTSNDGVLIVTGAIPTASAADAQAQRDRINLLIATAGVFASGLSGGRTLPNLVTALNYTLGVLSLGGTGYPANTFGTRIVSQTDYIGAYDYRSTTANGLSSKWSIHQAMGTSGDYTFYLDGLTVPSLPPGAWDVVVSMPRPMVTTLPSANTAGEIRFTGQLGGPDAWLNTHGDSTYLVPSWVSDPPQSYYGDPADLPSTAPTVQFHRRSYLDTPMHVKIMVQAYVYDPPPLRKVITLPTYAADGTWTGYGSWCGDYYAPVYDRNFLKPNDAVYNYLGECPPNPPVPGMLSGGMYDVDMTPNAATTAIELDVTRSGRVSGDVNGGLDQDFNVCGQTSPTICVKLRVQSKW